jgi:signal transduction histidine kinase
VRIRTKLVLFFILVTSSIVVISSASIFTINSIAQNREIITLETIKESDAVNEIWESYILAKSNLTELILLEQNPTEYQQQLDSVNRSMDDLRAIEEQPFEKMEVEIGEEEVSETIYESWQELYPVYAQIVESVENESSSESITILVAEAHETEEDFESNVQQRLESENEELRERARFTQELSNSSTNFLLMVIGSALVASIVGGIIISKSISSPIRKLVQAVRQISAGNFDTQLSAPNSNDEIAELFRNFGDMAKKVRLTNKYLNAQVRSKTRELELANEVLKQKDRLKDEFISIASHELKTPVHPILEIAEAVKDGLVGQEEAWDLVFKHAKRLQRLTNDILDVSRIETGQLTYYPTKVPINELIRNVINQTIVKLSKDVQIEIKLDREIEIDGDKDRLVQVFANILDNAGKFTKKGKIKIESNVLDERNEIEIRITDTGIGITPEILPEIFGKFVTKGESGGTGLGLFISKAIVEAHGGSISAQNNKKGATFTIILPIIRRKKAEQLT